MGVTSLLPLVFYISLLSNTVRDMARRGEGIRSEEEKERIGEQDGVEKNKELGENYPSFLLSLKTVALINSSQSSDESYKDVTNDESYEDTTNYEFYDDGANNESYEDAKDYVQSFPDTPSVKLSGIASGKLMNNHSLAKSMPLGNHFMFYIHYSYLN